METAVKVAEAPQSAPETQPVQEPVFLRENWKRVLGTHCDDKFKFIRVAISPQVPGVPIANITNGSLLLRAPVQVPEGFYTLNARNELVPAEYFSEWMGYPDVEACKQPFDKMRWSNPIPYQLVGELSEFCESVRRYDGTVMVDKKGVCMKQNPSYCYEIAQKIGAELTIGGGEVVVDATLLKLALTEMLRYSHVYLSRDHRIDGKAPLVLGLDWGRCALVQPHRSWYH